MSQPESHPTQKDNLSGLSIEVNYFFYLSADSVSAFILGAVESLIRGLDDLMRIRILLIALCHTYTDSHPGSTSRFLASFRAFLLFGAAVRAPEEKS